MAETTVIRNGTIIDGSGGEPFQGDVAIKDGRITEVGDLAAIQDARSIDARGLMVTPGFIDIHSHSDFTILIDPRTVSSISQGVTMEVVGNCGYGCAVIGDAHIARDLIYGYADDVEINWHSTAGYLNRLDDAKPAINVATLVPNGQLRLATMGHQERAATSDELKAMKVLLTQSLEEGAFGYSTGLESGPELGATEEEIAELCRLPAKVGALYATHTRNRDAGAVDAIEEAIRTAEAADVKLQISHLTPRSGTRQVERSIELVEQRRQRGGDVCFDMHTRLFGTINLKAVLPNWAMKDGRESLARYLKDTASRKKMRDFRNLIVRLNAWDRVVLLDNPAFPELSRKSFAEISKIMGADPLDCAYDILLAEVDCLHRPMVILHSYTEDQLKMTYEHEYCMVGSDATALAPDGPLQGSMFHGAYTWASWFYRRMVRETKTFTPQQAIFKLSALPAQTLGLTDRGVIRKGACADLAIFDPEKFGETGTTFEPSQVATGMKHVLVNGVLSVENGKLTSARGGQVLRRPV
jgi:N-acyl-D-amino-acid deacylase